MSAIRTTRPTTPRYAIAGIDPTVAMTLTLLAVGVTVGLAPHCGRFGIIVEVVFFALLFGIIYPFCRYTAFGPRQFAALTRRPRPHLSTLIVEARQTLITGVRFPRSR